MGLVLSSLGFFVDVVFVFPFSSFFSRDTVQVVTGHPRTHLFGFFVFSFCPAALGLSPFLAVRPASWRFFGVPFRAPRVFRILLELTGLELARPLPSPFFGREAARVFCASCAWFLFSPFCFAATRFLVSPSRRSRRRGQERVISPAPRPSEGQGVPLEGGGLVPSLCCYCLVSCVWFWVTGTQAHCAKSLLFGGGALVGLLPGLSHARFVPCPRFFFPFFFLALGARSPTWIARRNLRTAIIPRTFVTPLSLSLSLPPSFYLSFSVFKVGSGLPLGLN